MKCTCIKKNMAKNEMFFETDIFGMEAAGWSAQPG